MLHCPRLLWITPEAPEYTNTHETIMNRASEASRPSRVQLAEELPQVDALFHIERAGSLRAALRQLDGDYFDVVLLQAESRASGHGLGWRDAVETLAAHPAGVPVVVLKSGGDMSDWGAALRSGAFDLVALPCRADALIAVCEHAVVTGEARRWHGVSLEEQFVCQVA